MRLTPVMIIKRLIGLLTIAFILLGCSSHDERLARVQEIVADSPKEAMALLDSIDREELSEYDRNLYDLMRIKGNDKMYVKHTSDSLYLNVKDYFSNHHKEMLPEVLYYGGRVYSDIGDYPRAIGYFIDALDEIGDNPKHLKLKGNLLSQMGELFNKMRLYEEAEQSLMKAIKVEESRNDSVRLGRNYCSLGYITLHRKRYKEAETAFLNAKRFSDPTQRNDYDAYLAYLSICKGDTMKAKSLIRNAIDKENLLNWSTVRSYALSIYWKAGVMDTAFLYAKQLALRDDSYAKEHGYDAMLSPELITFCAPDSLATYFTDYKKLLEDYLNENQNEAFLIQNAYYNYTLHEKEKTKAEKRNFWLIHIVLILTVAVLLAVSTVLYLKNKRQQDKIRLRETLEKLENLEKLITQYEEEKKSPKLPAGFDTSDLKCRIKEKLEGLTAQITPETEIPETITCSAPYREVLKRMQEKKVIPVESSLWDEIETTVLRAAPDFKMKFDSLAGGKLDYIDYRIALLIRFGVSSSKSAALIAMVRSGINYRRKKISKTIAGEKLSITLLDHIIRSL